MAKIKQTAYLAIQCLAVGSSKPRDFLFQYGTDGKSRIAVSPLTTGLVDLFTWCNDNGWHQAPHDSAHPVGVYEKEV